MPGFFIILLACQLAVEVQATAILLPVLFQLL